MSLQTKKILGIDITISSIEEDLEEIRKYLEKTRNSKLETRKNTIKPFIIYTPNPEIISFAQKDPEFARIVNTAQINLPDGAGVVWAMKKLHGVGVAKIPGIDFMLKFVNLAARESLRIGLIGGRGDLADVTRECLQAKYPKLSGWALGGPQLEIANNKIQIPNNRLEEITKKIIKDETDILFVGFGFPKQEYFIDSIKYQLLSIKYDKPLVLMAVGGSFDYISGRVARAPLFIRNIGLEWLFRLILQPWRLPRQLAGAEFFWKILIS